MAPAILITVGVVAMIDGFRHVGPFGYIGAILLVIGGVKLFQGGASSAGHRELPGPGTGPSSTGGTAVPPAPPSEVHNG